MDPINNGRAFRTAARICLITLGIAVLLPLGCARTSDPMEEANKRALQELQGSWVVVSWKQDGAERRGPRRITFGRKKYSVEYEPGTAPPSANGVIEREFTVDASKEPKWIVDKVGGGSMWIADKVTGSVTNIYRLRDDHLEICYHTEKHLRNTPPETFEAEKGSQKVLITLKREKS